MKAHARQRAFALLLVMITGGFVGPIVHRVQHGIEWKEERAAAREAAHRHRHLGVTLCESTAHIPAALQDRPCALCSGISLYTGSDHARVAPQELAQPFPGDLSLPAVSLAAASHTIRGPPAFACPA